MTSPAPEESRWRAAARQHRDALSYGLIGSLTLGLAPFTPHPHIYKQLQNIARGTLTQPIDIFDLAMHGAPWVLLAYALLRTTRTALSPEPQG